METDVTTQATQTFVLVKPSPRGRITTWNVLADGQVVGQERSRSKAIDFAATHASENGYDAVRVSRK